MFKGAQAELSRSLELLSYIQEALNESCIVTITNTNGDITYVNDLAHAKLEYTAEVIIGKHFSFSLCSDQEDVTGDIFRCLNDGRTWKGDLVSQTCSGKELWLHTIAVPISPENRANSQFVFISSDVTYQKELQRYTKELEQERELLHRSEKLTLAGQMAASVVHEIRNPIASLRGFTQLIYKLISDAHVRSYCNIMLDEFDRLNMILEEFLLLARPTVMLRKPTSLARLMNDVFTLILPTANEKNLVIHRDYGGPEIIIDCIPDNLKQVFINILKNSIEATPSGREITITAVQHDNQVYIHFYDQGCGIPKESLHRLGEPFYTTKKGGSGLGLMVTYGIIRAHGGQINIQSKENIGTEIEVILPCVQAVPQ